MIARLLNRNEDEVVSMKKIVAAIIMVFCTQTAFALSEMDKSAKYLNDYSEDVKNILDRAELLYSKEEIDRETERLSKEITEKLEHKNPVVLSSMIGGVVYTGILMEHLHFPLELDYIHVTRYRGNVKAQKDLQWIATPRISLKDRTVLVVDDVLDGGITLSTIVDYCKKEGASEVYTAVLT